jgi:hypothetical protein
MLARAPGDVAHANVAQVKRSPSAAGSPRPAWGNGAMCPATPEANAHSVPRTAVTSANGAPSRPAGRVQPCRFDLLPPCTPITARQRTPRSGWASRAARIGPLPGDQATVPPQDGARRTSRCARSLPGRSLISAASTARWAQSHRAPARCGAAPRPGAAAPSRSASVNAGERPSRTSQQAARRSDRADATTRPVIMPSSHAAPIAPGHSHRPTSGTPRHRCSSQAGQASGTPQEDRAGEGVRALVA